MQAAVQVEDLAGDEARQRRGEEAHGVGELLGLAEAADGDLRSSWRRCASLSCSVTIGVFT